MRFVKRELKPAASCEFTISLLTLRRDQITSSKLERVKLEILF